jgi:hypothetical protein
MCLGSAPSAPAPMPPPPPTPATPEPVFTGKAPTQVSPARSLRVASRQAASGASRLNIPLSTGGTTQTGLNIGK